MVPQEGLGLDPRLDMLRFYFKKTFLKIYFYTTIGFALRIGKLAIAGSNPANISMSRIVIEPPVT